MQPRKDDYEGDLRQVAEMLSKQPEWRDRGFWREYFYWSVRCVPCYVFLVFASSYNSRDGVLGSVDHLSPTHWMIGIAVAFFLGPAIVIVVTLSVGFLKIHKFGDWFRGSGNDRKSP